MLDLLFIDVQEDLPGIIDKIKVLITQLRVRLTQFCKQTNVLLVLKMREFYLLIYNKLLEFELRVSQPLILGIFMLQ